MGISQHPRESLRACVWPGIIPQASSLKPQASSLKPQAKPQASSLKPQASPCLLHVLSCSIWMGSCSTRRTCTGRSAASCSPGRLRVHRELSDAMMGRPPQPSFEAMIRWHSLPTPGSNGGETGECCLSSYWKGTWPPCGSARLAGRLGRCRDSQGDLHQQPTAPVDGGPLAVNAEPRFSSMTAEDIVCGKRIPRSISRRRRGLGSIRPRCSCWRIVKRAAGRPHAAVYCGRARPDSANQDFRVASLIAQVWRPASVRRAADSHGRVSSRQKGQ